MKNKHPFLKKMIFAQIIFLLSFLIYLLVQNFSIVGFVLFIIILICLSIRMLGIDSKWRIKRFREDGNFDNLEISDFLLIPEFKDPKKLKELLSDIELKKSLKKSQENRDEKINKLLE